MVGLRHRRDQPREYQTNEKRAGTPVSVKVYPETGTREEQGHCFGGAGGMHIWAADAQAFFKAPTPAD